MLRNVAH